MPEMKRNLLLIVGVFSFVSLLLAGCDNGTKPPSPQKISEIKFEKETINLSVGERLLLKGKVSFGPLVIQMLSL